MRQENARKAEELARRQAEAQARKLAEEEARRKTDEQATASAVDKLLEIGLPNVDRSSAEAQLVACGLTAYGVWPIAWRVARGVWPVAHGVRPTSHMARGARRAAHGPWRSLWTLRPACGAGRTRGEGACSV